jgi:hypothetical protein
MALPILPARKGKPWRKSGTMAFWCKPVIEARAAVMALHDDQMGHVGRYAP